MLQSKYLKLVKHDNYAKLRTTIQLLNSMKQEPFPTTTKNKIAQFKQHIFFSIKNKKTQFLHQQNQNDKKPTNQNNLTIDNNKETTQKTKKKNDHTQNQEQKHDLYNKG